MSSGRTNTSKASRQDIEEGNDVLRSNTVIRSTANSIIPLAVEVCTIDESINQSSSTALASHGSSISDSLRRRTTQKSVQLAPQQGPPDAPASASFSLPPNPVDNPPPPLPISNDADLASSPPVTPSYLQSTSLPEHRPDSEPSTSKNFFRKVTAIHWITLGVLLLVLVLVIVLVRGRSTTKGDETTTVSPGKQVSLTTIAILRERDVLRCGVVPEQDGFSMINSDTSVREGFEADLCRAIAAAALGSGGKVEFVPLTPSDRFLALQNGTVDVLASHTTETMDRDVYEATAQAGFTFSTPYIHDGLTFGGQPEFVDCADRLGANCTGLRICVVSGTTHAESVKELIPSATINEHLSLIDAYDRFTQSSNDSNRRCNVIAGGQFEVAETVVRKSTASLTREYKVGVGIFSHEPLALATRDGDPFWSDVVQWVIQTLLAAEEEGITQKTSARMASSPYFGAQLSNLFQNAISEVGNYGELYERHLASILPRAQINGIDNGTSGRIFSLPFGSSQTQGPGPVDGGTLKRIKDRGHLRCGIKRYPGFAELDTEAEVWKGFDIDFCKAVAAAIFDGVSRNVVYTVLPATERFTALANGDVDILSRYTTWNLERDVAESSSGGKGFDFSQVNFYDGVAVGGIPQFAKCADNIDKSTNCQGLRVCVNSGTTTIDIARDLFRAEGALVEKQSAEQVIQGLVDGDCNAVIGGALEIAESSIKELGFEGEYKMGSSRFSKDPLALVTRQDDPQFSAFVQWIVSATFYAEEKGIDRSTAEEMPLVSVFGPLYSRMMKNAIQATGNYGEIYDRHLQYFLPRGGLNALSVNPYGPRHYALPGTI